MSQFKNWTSPSGGEYRVWDDGKVEMRVKDGWRVTGRATSHGYHNFGGSKDGVRWMRLVHRVVAECFIPNPEGKPQVDHIDGNRANNAVSNLRWATHQENLQNQTGRGCYRDGDRWHAYIWVNGKNRYLGMYDTEKQAHQVYIEAKQIHHTFWARQ